jgi:hypothetical protein
VEHKVESACLIEPYRAREIRFLQLWNVDNWRVKVYGITHHGRNLPNKEMIETVKVVAFNRLAKVNGEQHYGAAFVIMHMARESEFVSIDWWTSENVLQQSLFTCPANKPAQLQEITSTGLLACVWELEVHNFERMAWIEQVLKKPKGPNLEISVERYLNQRFNGWI